MNCRVSLEFLVEDKSPSHKVVEFTQVDGQNQKEELKGDKAPVGSDRFLQKRLSPQKIEKEGVVGDGLCFMH